MPSMVKLTVSSRGSCNDWLELARYETAVRYNNEFHLQSEMIVLAQQPEAWIVSKVTLVRLA